MKDLKIQAYVAHDSRNKKTVEVKLVIGSIEVKGDVPAGASKGEDEAATVDVETAISNIHDIILPMINNSGLDLAKYEDLLKIEAQIIEASGENFVKLGANAVLPVSRALWRAAAALNDMELWKFIRENDKAVAGTGRVSFYMNIFNGGLHALKPEEGEVLGKDRIDIQEIMVVPVSATSYAQALEMGEKIDQVLKGILTAKFGAELITRADEAGFSVKGLGDSTEAFGYVFDAIKSAGYIPGKDVKLALDVAASSFYDFDKEHYVFQGKVTDSDGIIDYLVGLVERYPGIMLSIEDGLAENDWAAWTKLSAEMKKRGVVTIGDDLFVTQMPRLSQGIESDAAHAILVKVNQNGSVSGTLQVMKHAMDHGMKCIISHRSGETLDDSIADLAYATGAFGLKTGDPQPEIDFADKSTWVRRAKYLRMVEIEKQDQ
ncbi:phosphopyruvate hydratase [Myxococcota bacterium]|nr:phosphopyruvate hydratase [Myxococcota bacterium]